MFHLTLFGAAEARLTPEGSTSFTVFGSTTLRSLTVAQRVVRLAQRRERPPSRWHRWLRGDQIVLVTVFGYTEVTLPHLVEEYVALRDLAARPDLSRDQLRGLCDTLRAHESDRFELSTVTLFGHCQIGRPTQKRELAAIERARKAGDIDAKTGSVLERLVGRTEPAIIDGLAQAALL